MLFCIFLVLLKIGMQQLMNGNEYVVGPSWGSSTLVAGFFGLGTAHLHRFQYTPAQLSALNHPAVPGSNVSV